MLVHCSVTIQTIKFTGTRLYTWLEEFTVWGKVFAENDNALPRSVLEPDRWIQIPAHLPLGHRASQKVSIYELCMII